MTLQQYLIAQWTAIVHLLGIVFLGGLGLVLVGYVAVVFGELIGLYRESR